MSGGEITAKFRNNNIYQYTQMVNAPAGGQAGAARCCHRAKCLAWRLGYTEALVGDLSCCNLPKPVAQMRQGRQARVAYKGSSYVKPSEDRSLGNRAYGCAHGAEPVPSRVFNTGLEPYGCEGYGLKRLWGCCGGACGRGGR